MTSPAPLNQTTRRVHEALLAYVEANQYPPSVSDLMAATGIRSKSSITWHLDRLQDAGLIRRTPGVSRGIVLLDAEATDRP